MTDVLRARATKNLADTLGIQLVELTKERVVATMPVDERTRQPFGILHGGASVALAETVASLAGTMNVDLERFHVVGIEINANHIRAKKDGVVTGTATSRRSRSRKRTASAPGRSSSLAKPSVSAARASATFTGPRRVLSANSASEPVSE